MRIHRGFTIIELLTAVSIVGMLTALLVPVLKQARMQGRRLQSMHRQKEIVTTVTLFACDNDDFFPPSTAVCQFDNGDNRWNDPRQVKTTAPIWGMEHTSVAGYLSAYLKAPDILFCPSSPRPYPFWEEAWQAADQWDHPLTGPLGDALWGSYCFYWNYTGYRPDSPRAFKGPSSLTGRSNESTMLVSDYFGADGWIEPNIYGSCEYMRKAEILPGRDCSSAYWKKERNGDLEDRKELPLRLQAGFVDGHVEIYRAADTVILEASETSNGSEPYWHIDLLWPGFFFIPSSGK